MSTRRCVGRLPHLDAAKTSRRPAAGLPAALLLAAAGLVAAPLSAAAAVPGKPTDKYACVRITQQGAVANDTADDTAAIQRALAVARTSSSKCVYVPSGTFRISRITIDGGVRMIGDRDASILFAPNPANRQVKLDGVGPGIYSVKLLTYGTKRTNDNEGVWIEGGASNWVVDDVTIDGGNGPGIITYGSHHGRITRNRVSNTKSDSIHVSGGAHDIYIGGNKVRNSGDDSIAVVTYEYHPRNTYEVLIENNNIADQPWGRGISVVGGENVTIRNNVVTRSSDAGIYLAAESSWVTRGVRNVLVTNNRLSQCPSAHPEHGQSSILAYSDNKYLVENVLLDANTITSPRNLPIRVDRPNTVNIACRSNTSDGRSTTHSNCNGSNPYAVTGTRVTSGGDTPPLP